MQESNLWLLDKIIDQIPSLITMVGQDGTVYDCNARCEEYLGYTKDEIIGYPIQKYIHPDSQTKATETLMQLFRAKATVSGEYRMVKKSGEVIDVAADSCIVTNADGREHTLCVITDITERKRAELILRESAQELKKSNEELEQFAYVASHDLQEPLRVVSSYCQLLKGRCDTCELREQCRHRENETEKYLTYVIEATARMKTLVKELLDFSRVGRKDHPFEKLSVHKIVEEVIQDFSLKIRELNANIIIEDKLPDIFAIKFRIKQLIHNLLSNSLKFCHPDRTPEIRMGCCEEDNFWLFFVKDNGIGIESKYYDRIFGLFKRLYSREEYPGTGIGLALCERIVETHGGKIWVDSVPREGSCFYFTLSKHINVK
jgi:PAS domain S-box-containing protein